MLNRLLKTLFVIIAFQCVTLLVLIAVRFCAEARYIPGTAMQPTLTRGDRIFLEKASKWRANMIERGAIVCFYLPASEMLGGKDLALDIPHILGRLTGLPIFPCEPAYIKRIIGVAGDHIRIEPGLGVFVNDQLLQETYVASPADYSLSKLSDISRRAPFGEPIHPYGNSNEPIVVPKGMIFVLGDNRNNSEDSHVWGFIKEDRVIGRAWLMISPHWQYMHEPNWTRPLAESN